jgi:hypothetical protein
MVIVKYKGKSLVLQRQTLVLRLDTTEIVLSDKNAGTLRFILQ